MNEPPLFKPEGLLNADVYPHGVRNLQLVETHISWIVLTGDFAYKIKKALRFDFIDTSTLAKRKYLCEEEVRLNRRLAPEMYLDVQPIVMRDGRLRIGGAGPALEFAVRMKQFNAADELLALLRTNNTSIDEIAALAECIADFHQRANVLSSADGRQAKQPGSAALDNVAELVSHLRTANVAVSVDDLVAWTKSQAHSLAEFMDRRVRDGKIRECHGDLHSGNIVRLNDRLVPFDCIEFNPDFRWIDVIDDIAFLFMDLWSCDRSDLAFALLNRYLEQTGDYEGLALLRFYGVYRALVRAKVDAMALEQQTKDSSSRQARLQRRLKIARELSQVPTTPILILMHGVSGSGKSWLSERLVTRVPALRIRSDVERKREPSACPSEQQDIYSTEAKRLTYERVLKCTEHCLANGFTTIVDATFLNREDREPFHALATRLSIPRVILACNAPLSVLAARVAARQQEHRDASDADLQVLQGQVDTLQPFATDEEPLVISAETNSATVVDMALQEIAKRAHHQRTH